MQNICEELGALEIRKTAAIEALPLEILEQIFSYLPRNDRLATSSSSRIIRGFNEEFTWKSIHVDVGDSSEFADRTERSKYLFEHLPYLYTTLSKYRHLARYTVELSLKVSRYRTYEMMMDMKFLRCFSSLQELSLSPPPSHFELPVKPKFLRLDFHYDRSNFWKHTCYEIPQLKLEQYFRMSDLRKLQVEHISFEPKMHEDAFLVPQQLSAIEDIRFIDCSPQTVGVLAKMLLSVKCLRKLTLEMNIPWPVAEGFDCNCHQSNWNRPGGQDYGVAINPHAQSLEELMIAFSDGASFFIRPFYAANPRAEILGMRPITNAQPLIRPVGMLDRFTNLKRLAIPEPLLAQDRRGTRFLPELLPKLLEQLQLQIPVDTRVPLLNNRTARMHSLAKDKDIFLPRLNLIICWHQQYASSSPASWNNEQVHDSEESWDKLREAFNAVGVHLDRVSGAFFEDTPFGRPLNISHSRIRPPNLVRQGQFFRDPARPGLYYDLSTQSVF